MNEAGIFQKLNEVIYFRVIVGDRTVRLTITTAKIDLDYINALGFKLRYLRSIHMISKLTISKEYYKIIWDHLLIWKFIFKNYKIRGIKSLDSYDSV